MNNSKPTIGIPGYKNPNDNFFGAGINNLDFITKFGNARIIAPWEEKVDVDLLYLPGGLDLSPSSYGQVPGFQTSNHDVMKEFFFKNRLKNYVKDTPIFGVCLGMQMLGAFFGSGLTQHLMYHERSPDRWEAAHDVHIVENYHSPRGHNFCGDEFPVNSHHHQAILKSQLSEELTSLAETDCEEIFASSKDKIVEAFKHKTLPIVGIQWHPEEWYDKFSIAVMRNLLRK